MVNRTIYILYKITSNIIIMYFDIRGDCVLLTTHQEGAYILSLHYIVYILCTTQLHHRSV